LKKEPVLTREKCDLKPEKHLKYREIKAVLSLKKRWKKGGKRWEKRWKKRGKSGKNPS